MTAQVPQVRAVLYSERCEVNIVAADICERVRYLTIPLKQAADDVVLKELLEQKGEGGVIALDPVQRGDAFQHHRHDDGNS